MPIPSPFHSKTAPLNVMHEWRDWAGTLAAGSYHPSYEVEYFAIRNAAAVIDVSPLCKYELSGPDAERAVDRIVTRDVTRCAVGQVLYTPWCDDQGYVVDDGTVARLAPDRFRVTAADPSLRWFEDCTYGMDVRVTDVTTELAALALQGPRSRAVLEALGVDLAGLGYFRLLETTIRDIPLTITRTGYTGDLGYELWLRPVDAEEVWELLFAAGAGHGLKPAGIAALDTARIEAGLLMIEVDFISARFASTAAQKSTPFELGLDWTVASGKPDFVGKRALAAAARRPLVRLVGLEVGYPDIERLFARAHLPPQVAGRATRAKIPIYHGRRTVGQATSLVFSPILKRFIALATVEPGRSDPGTTLELEMTVEHERLRVPATVVAIPFFNPPRKRAA